MARFQVWVQVPEQFETAAKAFENTGELEIKYERASSVPIEDAELRIWDIFRKATFTCSWRWVDVNEVFVGIDPRAFSWKMERDIIQNSGGE